MSYYDLSRPFSIDDWNNLLNDVNDKLQNPPEGDDCEPIDPIDNVTDPHIWSVNDVQTVRDKLIETCPDISFSEALEIWRPAIIDEIEAALEQVWCDCCDEEFLHSEEGTQIQLFDYPAEVHSNCFGDSIPAAVRLRDIIDGMPVGKSGIDHRIWTVWQMPVENYTPPQYWFPTRIAGGEISCEGAIEYTGTKWMPGFWGASVYCSICNASCQAAIDAQEANIAGRGNLVWYIEITTSGAECADCDE